MLLFSANSTTTGTTSNQVEDYNSFSEGVTVASDTETLPPTTGRFTFDSGTKLGYFINANKRAVIDIRNTTTAPVVSINNNQ